MFIFLTVEVVSHKPEDRAAAAPGAPHFMIARRLFAGGQRVVGFAPVGRGVEIGPLAAGIARALAQLSGQEVAVLRRGDAPDEAAPAPTGEGGVALLHVGGGDPFAAGDALARAADRHGERFARFLLDLSGVFPENVDALAPLDGVALVARAGGVYETELLRTQALIPEARALGVILIE